MEDSILAGSMPVVSEKFDVLAYLSLQILPLQRPFTFFLFVLEVCG
ncbi:unnamed protein product [Arabidopsis thaliana]|uniref:Uncharacterized protein n=2 Tax=Arabidopsis thaliana TaxID=3702 RepID=A0A654GFQ6_ARATH|nr:uncharacterized protein AT2G07648 [Arabidopsis thaliana]ANM62234.1 hypothetical protein AT2G07648 [Arabidopsis thaliana]CAA0413920.1 unnamed protein product [Arabidopsis thaliana]VYS71804.1 unnamed protein product [Arabidopsis thaliana]|eukprot:NP_001324408.1 hypothetical protein AT2G07648 [Arabidopsis thaliana]